MPKTTLRSLANHLEGRAKAINKEGTAKLNEVALVILARLVYVTPVDTSRALSNWQIGLGAPVLSAIEPFYTGEAGSTKDASAKAAIHAAKAVLLTRLPGQSIYLSNALPYIERLNNNHSPQAPAGFVEAAVSMGKAYAHRMKIEV